MRALNSKLQTENVSKTRFFIKTFLKSLKYLVTSSIAFNLLHEQSSVKSYYRKYKQNFMTIKFLQIGRPI